jgi:hypothetical protein
MKSERSYKICERCDSPITSNNDLFVDGQITGLATNFCSANMTTGVIPSGHYHLECLVRCLGHQCRSISSWQHTGGKLPTLGVNY